MTLCVSSWRIDKRVCVHGSSGAERVGKVRIRPKDQAAEQRDRRAHGHTKPAQIHTDLRITSDGDGWTVLGQGSAPARNRVPVRETVHGSGRLAIGAKILIGFAVHAAM